MRRQFCYCFALCVCVAAQYDMPMVMKSCELMLLSRCVRGSKIYACDKALPSTLHPAPLEWVILCQKYKMQDLGWCVQAQMREVRECRQCLSIVKIQQAVLTCSVNARSVYFSFKQDGLGSLILEEGRLLSYLRK